MTFGILFQFYRAQFEDWCRSIIHEFPEYTVEFDGVGYQGGVRTPEGPPCSQVKLILFNCHYTINLKRIERS